MLPIDVTVSDDATTELGQAGAMLFAELEEAHAAKATAEDRIERARKAIELLAGDAQEIHVGGQLVATWKPQVSRRFDQATAKRFLTAEQIDACMVETESRPFRRTA